jgi:dCMP deaminase
MKRRVPSADQTRNGHPRRNGSESPGRPDYIEDWDQYFHRMAVEASRKSKDPKCPVGAVIVSQDEVVISTGFNGFARGVYDDKARLADVKEKLRWICHAEMNAISNAARTGVSTRGSTIYTTKFPCFNCCNSIAQAGIKRIYTLDNKYWGDDPVDGDKVSKPHSRKRVLLKQAGIHVDAPFHPDFDARWRFPRNGTANGQRGDRARRLSIEPSSSTESRLVGSATGSTNGKKRPLI